MFPLPQPAAMLALGAVLLSACSSIGEGTYPSKLSVTYSDDSSVAEVSECSIFNLNAIVTFDGDDSSSGDFSERVSWDSSDPGVVSVSNGDLIPEGTDGRTVYGAGVVIARRPGTATVRAEYLDFTASIVVEVLPLSDIRIEPELAHVAARTRQNFALVGEVEGNPDSYYLTDLVSWEVEPAANNAYMDVDYSGRLVAGSADAQTPVRVVAQLPECGRYATQELTIVEPTGFALRYEATDNGVLPLGYSETVQLWAQFADGSSEQNLTNQIAVEVSDAAQLQALTIIETDTREYALVVEPLATDDEELDDADPVYLDISLERRDEVFRSKSWELAALELVAMDSATDALSITYPDTYALEVSGTFEDGSERAITRHLNWIVSDGSGGSVGSSYSNAGLVSSSNERANITVRASSSDNDDLSALEFEAALYPYQP